MNNITPSFTKTQLFSTEKINNEINRIILEIKEDYNSENMNNILLCIILKGGYKFGFELCKGFDLHNINYDITFVDAKSYGENTESGDITLHFVDDVIIFKNKNVLIVDDILDSGKTIYTILNYIKTNTNNENIRTAVLVDRKNKRSHNFQHNPNYVGFMIRRPHFLVGYGMGWGEKFRNDQNISILTF